VPAAMKTASAFATGALRSVVKSSRPALTLEATSASSPGSKIGISRAAHGFDLSDSLPTQVTWWPKSAKQAPETSPT
jgi:hypothetical protein